MEEDLVLLQKKYNDLLQSYTKGQKYLVENPDDEKAQKRLLELSTEMENVIKAFPNITEEEIQNGFKIEEVKPVETKMVVAKQKEENVLSTFGDDWKIANQLAKSSILPDNYRGKVENVIIAVRFSKTNEFTTIYSNAKFSNNQGKNKLEWKFLQDFN